MVQSTTAADRLKTLGDGEKLKVKGEEPFAELLTPQDIVLSNVSFRYPDGERDILSDLSLIFPAGTAMILDEASSALDPDTERQILEEIQHTQTGKTLIWVTHHEVVKDYMQRVVEVK